MRSPGASLLFLGLAVSCVGFTVLGCQASFSADDLKSGGIGTKNAAELLDECATDDAGTCTPALVRTRARIIFCASQHSLVAHGTPFDGGPPCPNPQ